MGGTADTLPDRLYEPYSIEVSEPSQAVQRSPLWRLPSEWVNFSLFEEVPSFSSGFLCLGKSDCRLGA